MTTLTELTAARSALADATTAFETLEARCCDPDRSPQMRAIAEALDDVRCDLAPRLAALPGGLLESF